MIQVHSMQETSFHQSEVDWLGGKEGRSADHALGQFTEYADYTYTKLHGATQLKAYMQRQRSS